MLLALISAATIIVVTSILCFSALRAWRAWLAVRRPTLERSLSGVTEEQDIGLRIELAALRERVKQLERIAAGVDL